MSLGLSLMGPLLSGLLPQQEQKAQGTSTADPKAQSLGGANILSQVGAGLGAVSPLLGAIGGFGGFLDGGGGSGASADDYNRFGVEFEPVQQQALANNMQDRARLQQQNPEADRRQKAMALREGMSGAMAQAGNIAGGQVAASGLGGDVNSAQIAGIKAAAPTMAAASPFAQALAQGVTEKSQQEAQINQQLQNNTMQGAQIGDMTNYVFDGVAGEGSTRFADGLGMLSMLPQSMGAGSDALQSIFNNQTR